MLRVGSSRRRWLLPVTGRQRSMALLAAAVAGVLCAMPAASASAHASFLGATPEPGTLVPGAPGQVALRFTEDLNARLTSATVLRAPGGQAVAAQTRVSGSTLVLRVLGGLAKGAYRVRWHSVASDDGHALEGFFSFGVQVPAVGGESAGAQSPFARWGWLRVLARAVMYATLLLFAGAVMLRGLLGVRGRSWLVPPTFHARPEMDAVRVARRELLLLRDVGFVAALAAALSGLADGADAAGGLTVRGLHDYLLASQGGLARVSVVVLALGAAAIAARHPRVAALPAGLALGALAFSGHAAAASPRSAAIAVDWVHLVAGSVWLGGIALIVVIWSPVLRAGPRMRGLAVAREVLPVFGRVALPAFALVVVSGGVSALIELGSVGALWQTDYGRVLAAKMVLVVLVAGASCVHALRLRPRMLAAGLRPLPRVERHHWRLLCAEPVLAAVIVMAVALLVAFPLPPRQLRAAAAARAATPACDPCALPSPLPGELAVAEQGGSDVVAGWIRHSPAALSGTIRIYTIDGKPAIDRFAVKGARQTPCGVGCARFSARAGPGQLSVEVRQRNQSYVARLATRSLASGGVARRLLDRAQARMRALRSVRESERVESGPGSFAATDYALVAPDRLALATNGGVHIIALGATQWERLDATMGWERGRFASGLPFRTRTWFTWSTYARAAYLLATGREGRHRVAVVALMDPGTPAWWRLYIDQDTDLVLHSRLITNGHFSTQRYFAFDAPTTIQPPTMVTREH